MAIAVGTAPNTSPVTASSTDRVSKMTPGASTQGVSMSTMPMTPMSSPATTCAGRPILPPHRPVTTS